MPLLFGEVAIDGEQPLIEFAFESGLIDPGPDDDDDEDEYGSSNIEMVWLPLAVGCGGVIATIDDGGDAEPIDEEPTEPGPELPTDDTDR